jgi:hypothetical protein
MYATEELKTHPLVILFFKLYEQEDEALKLILKSVQTLKIFNANRQRVWLYTWFRKTITRYTQHFNDELVNAAQELQILTKTFGTLRGKTYDAITTILYNLLQELRTEKYAALVEKLGLSNWATEIESKNEAFEQLMNKRYKEAAEKTELRMCEIRREIDPAYRNIINTVNSLILFEGGEYFYTFVREMNGRIDRFNDIAAQQKGRRKKKKEKEAAAKEESASSEE